MKLDALVIAAVLSAVFSCAARAEELGGTLAKIKKTGVITLGYRDASIPFSYIGPDNKPTGYSIDLCLRIVDAIKSELSLPSLRINLVPVTAQTRVPLLTNGTIDLECGSTTHTLTRAQQVDFLSTTFITGSRLVVKRASGLKEIEDFKGRVVAVGAGSSNERVAEELNAQKSLGYKIVSAKDLSQAWLALETDRADAFLGDDVILHGFVARSKKPDDYVITGKFLSFDPYGIMIRRDESAFRLVANKTLAQLFRSGEIKEIYKRWFDQINMPLQPLLETAFEIQAFPE
jgi:glutamate/aspartate transport system substrate-binding protein